MIRATWRNNPSESGDEVLRVRTDADVDDLVRRLAGADDAYLLDERYADPGDAPRVTMFVHASWIYLTWSDAEFYGAPEGDPRSPETHGTNEPEYYSGTGVSLDLGTRALRQWLATRERPDVLNWVTDEVLYERRYGHSPALSPDEQAEVTALFRGESASDVS